MSRGRDAAAVCTSPNALGLLAMLPQSGTIAQDVTRGVQGRVERDACVEVLVEQHGDLGELAQPIDCLLALGYQLSSITMRVSGSQALWAPPTTRKIRERRTTASHALETRGLGPAAPVQVRSRFIFSSGSASILSMYASHQSQAV